MITALDRAPELAKYELLERIGMGGMATVYRARDRRLGREVAVKLIHSHLRENPEVAARFVTEAKAVARLRHPNVVEVYDVSDETEPERYLVVELVRGTTLRAVLARCGALPAELVAAIGLEVALGLAHAHEQGLVHRDVKPENVLVDLTGPASGPGEDRPSAPHPLHSSGTRIKLTDFGIAKLLDAQGVTSTGQVLGSPAHMAPEQIEGGEVSPRSDVFALGVLLYESMVGRLPFDGKNPAQVLRRVLEGVYPPADREQPKVGARFAAILARALVKDPAGRFESVEVMAEALRAELTLVGITDPRAEIERFLGDQEAYAAGFEPRLVEGIVRSAEAARQRGDFLSASQQFNRALVYRPGDGDLVRRVSSLSRRARWRKGLRVGALGLAGAAAAFACVWGLVRGLGVGASAPAQGGVAAAPPARSAAAAAARPGLAPARPAAAIESATPKRRPPPPLLGPVARPRLAEEEGTRPVRVNVTGPKGGELRIDGARIPEWFGKTHELPLGEHLFEFVPADLDCCRPSPPVRRLIESGDEPEDVFLSVGFRDARLRVDRSPAGTLRCRSFAGGDTQVPGLLVVPMSRLTVTGLCTLTADGAALSAPSTKEVTLTAGQTTEITFP